MFSPATIQVLLDSGRPTYREPRESRLRLLLSRRARRRSLARAAYA